MGAEGVDRRRFLQRAGALGLGAAVAAAYPAALAAPSADAVAQLPEATLQAFADTILPGRPALSTDLGETIHPLAIAGVDDHPGAVEADALALYHHPKIGFDALEAPFLAELEARSLPHGAPFLELPFAERTAVCSGGLDFSNPLRTLWEAAAAVPFTAFCAAALILEQTAERASGYRVMGHPGRAPAGYSDASYGLVLASERTITGSLG